MKIKIYTIAKKPLDLGAQMDYAKMAGRFGAEISLINAFSARIQAAQKISPKAAQDAYGAEFSRFLGKDSADSTESANRDSKNHANYALDLGGKEVDSLAFSELLRDKLSVNFFIGGAFGFGAEFLQKTRAISLSKLTFGHSIVPLILCEQIYRALCILNNHPYHK